MTYLAFKILPKASSPKVPKDGDSREGLEGRKYKKPSGINRHTFGDFFVHEKDQTALKPEPPSKYTSYSPSTGFQLEADMIYNQKLEKAAVRKLDLRLIPMAAIFYFLSFLDRMNIGSAKVVGFQDDLQLTDHQFSMSLTMTFIPYILVELPSNLLLKRIGAGILLPALVTVWGVITFSHGFLSDYQGLLAARFFLGLAEGGLYPGLVLYLSSFYTRTELQLRIALFYSTACLSGAVSGLLTYGIIKLDGALGLAGWAWVFILEGIFTTMCGLLGFLFLPSTLEDAKFLNKEEKSMILLRLARDSSPIWGRPSGERKPITSPTFQVLQACKSPHVVLACIAYFLAGSNAYSVAYFQPSIVYSFGYTPSDTQLLSVPPYAVAFLFVLFSSYLSDRYRFRSISAITCAAVSALGFLMFYISDDQMIRYGSLFFTVAGVFGVVPTLAAWMGNNSEPYMRRATTLALGPIFGNTGGLMSVWMFAFADKPKYLTPTLVNIIFTLLLILVCLLKLGYLVRAEARKVEKRGDILGKFYIENPKIDASMQHQLYLDGWEYLGDRHPDFKYTF